MKITYPPDQWIFEEEQPINIYEKLLDFNSRSNDTVAIIIKKDESLHYITKQTASRKSKILANEIINLSNPTKLIS